MEENKEKEPDYFVKKIIQEIGLEEPSLNFTETVLSKIETAREPNSVTVYTPLISKFSWAILAVIVVGMGALALFGKVDTKNSWLEYINLDAVSEFTFLDSMANLKFPSTLVYGVLALTIFVYVQIFLLKNHLGKKYELH